MINQLGVIGLGTMGANLARNAARNGAKVAVYNRTEETMHQFMKDFGKEGSFVPCKSYEELTRSLATPRAILIMVKAGDPVDAVLEDLFAHLDKGDIIIDGGNSHFADTQRRFDLLAQRGIHYIGMGVSGGEEGALMGPSMMPGADKGAYTQVAGLFESMAADDDEGGKCIAFLGKGGAGHFVKMVHNGIEYGIMQLLAESYHLLKELGGYSNKKLAETFTAWNQTDELGSYLMEITARIFEKQEGGTDVIDFIKDAAKQKGTGKWTTQAALDLGVAVPTITAAVDARILSGSQSIRNRSQDLPTEMDPTEVAPPPEKLRSFVKSGLELSIITAYQQGFDLIAAASEEYDWGIDLSECARIWRNGCIIRSKQLGLWQAAYGKDPSQAEAATQQLTSRFVGERQVQWRKLLEYSYSRGVPTPALSASLNHYDTVRTVRLPQNLVQAQRDFFGAHTYERTDKEGTFHTEWEE